jgi:HEAT repeat protein
MKSTRTIVTLLLAALMFCWAAPFASAAEDLDKAFDALKTYEWGTDRAVLKPIDAAVVGSHGDAAARKDLETKLAGLLGGEAPQAAQDYICRQLSLIGTAESVPAIAPLLADEKLSHMGRYALERMPAPEAVAAMRDAAGKVQGKLKVGMINSLGVRRDKESVGMLKNLLADNDPQIASAAAAALGVIGTADAATALGAFVKGAPEGLKLAAADAYLACAEQLLADGNKLQAMMIYKALSGEGQPKHVRLAATRGLLAAAGSK